MTIDNIREYIVLVNGGSGCIFMPMTDAYSYVLTAKHIFDDINDKKYKGKAIIVRFNLHGGIWKQSIIFSENLIQNVNYFPHQSKDVAILKVPPIKDIEPIFRVDNINENRNNYILSGYPKSRRSNKDQSDWFRNNENLTVKELKNHGLREAKIEGNPDITEVKGQSGGGIVKIDSGKLILAGIQNKMVEGKEQLGFIEFSPIAIFDEIINEDTTNLAPILPPYLQCFSFLINDSFNLDAGFSQQNIEFTKNFLKHKAQAVVDSNTTPYFIKTFFKKRLLIENQKEEILQTKGLWLVWLEFLTILSFVKKRNLEEADLISIFNSYRLLYSSTDEDWSSELSNILYSDYLGLIKNGTVIISVKKKPANDVYVIDKAIPHIADIRRGANHGMIRTDQGINWPFDSFKFVHIDFFLGKSIIKRNEEYRDILEENLLLAKLKEVYEEVLTDN